MLQSWRKSIRLEVNLRLHINILIYYISLARFILITTLVKSVAWFNDSDFTIYKYLHTRNFNMQTKHLLYCISICNMHEQCSVSM